LKATVLPDGRRRSSKGNLECWLLLKEQQMEIKKIYEAVIAFEKEKVAALVKAEIDKGSEIAMILNEGLIAPLDEIGSLFSDGKIFIPEMLRAARAMKAGLELLRPFLESADADSKGTVVIGTVKGDMHDIGKNLVGMMLEGAGFKVIDLGVDVPVDSFVSAAKEHSADVVALSALLTTTMPAMEATVSAIRKSKLSVKTIVGGAPVNRTYSGTIGSDGYSEDAPGAVELVRKFLDG